MCPLYRNVKVSAILHLIYSTASNVQRLVMIAGCAAVNHVAASVGTGTHKAP
jgi:hypothetical protein